MGLNPEALGQKLGVTGHAIRNYNRPSGKYNPSRTTLTRMIELARSQGYDVDASWFDDPDSPIPYPRQTSMPPALYVREAGPKPVTEDERMEFVSACLHLVDALDNVSNAIVSPVDDARSRKLAWDWVGLAGEVLGDLARYEQALGASGTSKALQSQRMRIEAAGHRLARAWDIRPD